MAKRWDEPRPRPPQMIVTRTTARAGALTLAIVGAGVIGTGLGDLIGKAVVAVVRSVFSAVGGFLAH